MSGTEDTSVSMSHGRADRSAASFEALSPQFLSQGSGIGTAFGNALADVTATGVTYYAENESTPTQPASVKLPADKASRNSLTD